MSTSLAQIGFNSELENNFVPKEITFIKPIKMVVKKKKVVNGRVNIKLGKKKMVSIAPSTLINHIPATKLKAAAKSVIRHQTAGLHGSVKKSSRKGKKGKKKGKRNSKKVASFII